MVPRAFKSVLFLDVFGWVSQKGLSVRYSAFGDITLSNSNLICAGKDSEARLGREVNRPIRVTCFAPLHLSDFNCISKECSSA